MSIRAVAFVLALHACAVGGVAAAVAQNPPEPLRNGKTESETRAPPTPIEFYLAHGETDACGRDCNEWIAAEGKIDVGAAGRLRQLLKKLKDSRPPIYFHSPGGILTGGLELGRLIRAQKFEVSVGHTIPLGCGSDQQSDKSCAVQKRSGTAIETQISPTVFMCNSACVYALAGGTIRVVPPWVKLAIHDLGLDHPIANLSGLTLAIAMGTAHGRVRSYLREMGIDDALYSTALATPYESPKYLQRDEIVRFGIDRREFGETAWQFSDTAAAPQIEKRFFVRTDGDQPHYVDGAISVACVSGRGTYLMFARQRLGSDPDSSIPGSPAVNIAIKGEKVSLTRTASSSFYVRSGRVALNTLDPVGDDVTVELPGTEFGRKELGNVTLSMDGFSAAYAKLRPLCVKPPSYPQAALPPPQMKQTASAAQTAPFTAVPLDSTVLWQQKLELTRVAPAEQKLRLDFLYKILKGCSSAGLLAVNVLAQPQHGALSIAKGQAFTDFPRDDERAACNTRESSGTLVFYQPNADYRGPDSVTLYVVSPLGDAVTRHYSIEVK